MYFRRSTVSSSSRSDRFVVKTQWYRQTKALVEHAREAVLPTALTCAYLPSTVCFIAV